MKVTCKITGYTFNAGTLPLDIKGEHPVFGLNAQQLTPLLSETKFLDLSTLDKNLVVAARLRLSPVVELRHWVSLGERETLAVFNGLHILEWAERNINKVPHFAITANKDINVNSYLEILTKLREERKRDYILADTLGDSTETEENLEASDNLRAKQLLASLGNIPSQEVNNLNKKTAAYVLASVGHPADSPLTHWYLKLLSTSFDNLVCLEGFRVEDLRYIQSDLEDWESYSLLKPIALASVKNKIELLSIVGVVAIEDKEDYPATVPVGDRSVPTTLPKSVSLSKVKVTVHTPQLSPVQQKLQALMAKRQGN